MLVYDNVCVVMFTTMHDPQFSFKDGKQRAYHSEKNITNFLGKWRDLTRTRLYYILHSYPKNMRILFS